MTKIDFTLTGCANGHPVRIEGKGTTTRKLVELRFSAIEAPFTFNAGLAHFAGGDALAALAAGHILAADGPVVARCRADLLGEGGVEVGTMVATVAVERRRGRIVCRAQLAEAHVSTEVDERITAIDARVATLAPQAGGVALFSATTVSTSRGREWTVLTSALLVGGEVGEQRTVHLPAVRMN